MSWADFSRSESRENLFIDNAPKAYQAQNEKSVDSKEVTGIKKVGQYAGAFFLGLVALPATVAITAVATPLAAVGTVLGGIVKAVKAVVNGVGSAISSLKGSERKSQEDPFETSRREFRENRFK